MRGKLCFPRTPSHVCGEAVMSPLQSNAISFAQPPTTAQSTGPGEVRSLTQSSCCLCSATFSSSRGPEHILLF